MIRKTFLSALAVGTLLASGVIAQEREAPQRDVQRDRGVNVDVQISGERESAEQRARGEFGRLDSKTTGQVIRASQLIGMNVESRSGESLGEVNDLVLDAGSGRIRYAALSFGGVLGIGDKLFAVPWQMFSCTRDPEDSNEFRLVLNVEEEALKNAPGFDQSKWPDMADKRFSSQVDEFYLKLDRNAPQRGAVRPGPASGEIDR
jgi:sporulation protein YlmC with PRC-barrel domain